MVMFPYPSGNGLHVGHAYNYAVMDSYYRWENFKGVETFQPFGYDAFGLPAENYAIKHNRDPREVTYENIDQFRSQMDRMNVFTCVMTLRIQLELAGVEKKNVNRLT